MRFDSYKIDNFHVYRKTPYDKARWDRYAVVHQQKVTAFAYTLLLKFASREKVYWALIVVHFDVLVVANQVPCFGQLKDMFHVAHRTGKLASCHATDLSI